MFCKRKTWDNDHVLKCKLSTLIPAFDPRPAEPTPKCSSFLFWWATRGGVKELESTAIERKEKDASLMTSKV